MRQNFFRGGSVMAIALLVVLAYGAAPAGAQTSGNTEPVPGHAQLDARIVEVTVYGDRARVTRSAVTQIPAGPSVVEIGGLTTGLDEKTIEVTGKSGSPVTIRSVDVGQQFWATNANPRTAEVQGQLDNLLAQKASLDAQIALAADRESFFKSIGSGVGHSEKGAQDVDDLKKVYDFYVNGLTDAASTLLELQTKERSLQLEIDRTKLELNGLSQQKAVRKVLVNVDASAATELTLFVRYTVSNAAWEPVYDARVNTSDGSVQLGYSALVRQKTGEDWTGVRLSVSTARPGENGELPELSPDYLTLVAPQVTTENPEGAPRSATKAESIPVPMARAPGQQAAEVNIQNASLQTAGLAVTYLAANPVDIPGDGQPHQTNLNQLKLNGQLAYVATPKLELGAFVKVHLTNSSPDTLLAGDVHVFRDGDLIGKVAMREIVAGAEFDLFCGRDDAIKIDRKELVNRQAETGLFNHRRQRQQKYQITVQNHRKTPVQITVYDQLPVSQDSQISVAPGQISPKPATLDKDSGKVTWNFGVDPQAKQIIEFEYTVEWPADKQISY